MAGGKQEAVVLFAYEKAQEDELSLNIGQIIQDVIVVDEGWCEGTLDGKRGMFPDNFVELRPAQSAAQPQAQPPPASKSSIARESASTIKSRRHKVAYSYAAENADELSLQPGEIVEVIGEEEEGWFRGRLNGKEGVFPNNFLEPNPLPNEPTPTPPAPEPAPPKEEPAAPKQPVMGHKLFPSINPALARAQLKSSASDKKPAPPIPAATAPKTEKLKAGVERAKVIYDYNAENEDEISIKTGETVEIILKDTGQDGWWKVKLGDKVGLVPDNFVELLPATAHPPPTATKAKPPSLPNEGHQQLPPKEIPAPAPPSKGFPPRNSSVSRPSPSDPSRSSSVSRSTHPDRPPPSTEPKNTLPVKEEEDASDFGVPHTDPLDSSAIKNRPKKVSRPPSRSNLLMEDGTNNEPPPVEPKATTPWQAEIQKRKVNKVPPAAPAKQPKAPKKAAVKPPEKPSIASAKPIPAPSKPQTVAKPHIEPTSHPPRDTPSPHSQPAASPVPPPNVTPTHTPAPIGAVAAATPADNSWKEAYENLRDEFEKFKKYIQQQVTTLTNDLDDERKLRRGLEVDIDRLKKQPSYP